MANKIVSYVGNDIVIEGESHPRLGQSVFIDSDFGRVKIAKVYDIIGTVDSPFIVAKIFSESKKYIKSYEDLINKPVYLVSSGKKTKKGYRNEKKAGK